MPRNDQGVPVAQCENTYTYEHNVVHCTKVKDHDGKCQDARGSWESPEGDEAEDVGDASLPIG